MLNLKLVLLAVGVLMVVLRANAVSIYDPEVLRELKEQLRSLEEEDALAERRRAEEDVEQNGGGSPNEQLGNQGGGPSKQEVGLSEETPDEEVGVVQEERGYLTEEEDPGVAVDLPAREYPTPEEELSDREYLPEPSLDVVETPREDIPSQFQEREYFPIEEERALDVEEQAPEDNPEERREVPEEEGYQQQREFLEEEARANLETQDSEFMSQRDNSRSRDNSASNDNSADRSAREEAEEESPSNCPSCSSMSVCCRKDDAFACCPKIYKLEGQQIEINDVSESATYYYTKGSIRFIDFTKMMMYAYEPEANACYVASGIDFTLEDVIAAAEGKASEDNKAFQEHYYKKMDAKPLEDVSLLPELLQEKCLGKPIYWDERIHKETAVKEKSRRMLDGRDSTDQVMCMCVNCEACKQ